MEFKDFKVKKGSILVASTLGHAVVVTTTPTPVPSILWKEAYSLGCVPDEITGDNIDVVVALKLKESQDAKAALRTKRLNLLRSIVDEPKDYVNSGGYLVLNKTVSLFNEVVPMDELESLWEEVVSELDSNGVLKPQVKKK